MENDLTQQKQFFDKNETFANFTNHLQEIDQNLEYIKPVALIKKHADLNENVINSEIKDKLGILIESFNTLDISYPVEYYPDLLQLHEFLNAYLKDFGLRATFPNGIFLDYLESAIIDRHSTKLYQLMFIFLATVFKYHSIECEQYKYTKNIYDMHVGRFYECEVHELPCDEFTISEVLRLHLLKSSMQSLVKTNDYDYDEIHDFCSAKQKLAQEFIKKHGAIIQALHHETIYHLSSGDLLKIFIFLLNQILTFEIIRVKTETCLDSLPNYLGCDQSDRKYWRFDSLPGIYIECTDSWKCIDKIDNMYLLIEVVQETTLKQNLIKHKKIIAESILQSEKRPRKRMINNYNFKNFKSSDNWFELWKQKFSNYQNLIKKFKLGCQDSQVDFYLFQNDFLQWIIPQNVANLIFRVIHLSHKQHLIIERRLCQKYNIPEITFPENYLEKIKKLATDLAYAYYMLDGRRIKETQQERNRLRTRKFESFLHIESVAELFLCLYKLYEDLLMYHGKCHICHTDRVKPLRTITCNKCERPIHASCLESVPIGIKLNSKICEICQFRLV